MTTIQSIADIYTSNLHTYKYLFVFFTRVIIIKYVVNNQSTLLYADKDLRFKFQSEFYDIDSHTVKSIKLNCV